MKRSGNANIPGGGLRMRLSHWLPKKAAGALSCAVGRHSLPAMKKSAAGALPRLWRPGGANIAGVLKSPD
jgi:hypothetical protein